MNSLIETLLQNFIVDGVEIPVKYLYYDGGNDVYITYMQIDADASFSGDDELLGYVDYYDFDIYYKGNYKNIVKELRKILENNGFKWQPSRTSPDMYELETGYYHKTLNFAILREEILGNG